MATATHTNGRTTTPLNTINTINTVNMEAHRRTASVDSSYSAFFTSGLLSPPSSPAMSPTSPTSPTSPSTSKSPFASPSRHNHNPYSKHNHTRHPNHDPYPKHNHNHTRTRTRKSSRAPVRVDPTHPLPPSSMLELASPSSPYAPAASYGDALYFVALLQQMEDNDDTDGRGEGKGEGGGEGGEGEGEGEGAGEGEKDLRELTSFLSLDASSQYTRSTRPAMSSSPTTRSTSTRFPFPSAPIPSISPYPSHSQHPQHSLSQHTQHTQSTTYPCSPSSPTASTSSTATSTSTSTSASVSPITPPSYPFAQHPHPHSHSHSQQHHPYQQYHHHPYQHPDSTSNSNLHLPKHKSGSVAATITDTDTNIVADGKKSAPNNAKIHPRSFLPSLRHGDHHPRDSSPSNGNNAHARIPSLTLPPPIVSSFVFDDEDEDEDEEDFEFDEADGFDGFDGEGECDVSQPQPTHPPANRAVNHSPHRKRTPNGGARTAPLLAAFPAPPPTSLALRLSLHLPQTSLFFDDLDAEEGEGEEEVEEGEGEEEVEEEEEDELEGDREEGEGDGEEEEGMRESYLSLASPTSPPRQPQPHPRHQPQQGAARRPSNPPHTRIRKPSTILSTSTTSQSTSKPTSKPKPASMRRTVGSRKSSTRRAPAVASALSALSVTRTGSQRARWRGKRFTQVSTTSSASVSTGYRTCMRADALAALEGRVLRGGVLRGGDVDEGVGEGTEKGGDEEEGVDEEAVGGGEGEEVLMSTWSDEEEGEDGGDLWEDDEGVGDDGEWTEEGAQAERRAEMSWMDFNQPSTLSALSTLSTRSPSSKWGGTGGLSRGLSSKSYKWKSMYSVSTSASAFASPFAFPGADVPACEGEVEGWGREGRGGERPFSASSTSLPNLPFPSTSTHFPSASTSSAHTIQFDALSPTSTSSVAPTSPVYPTSPVSPTSPTAMLSPLSYSSSFALRALSFALPPRVQPPPPPPSRQQDAVQGTQGTHALPSSLPSKIQQLPSSVIAQAVRPLAPVTNYAAQGKQAEGTNARAGMRGMREKGRGMTSFMFIDSGAGVKGARSGSGSGSGGGGGGARGAKEKERREGGGEGGFGKSFIDF